MCGSSRTATCWWGVPAWSPDGAWIAYIEVQGEFSHVWVMDADGNEARQLTFGDFWEQSPTWSPDGTHIAVGRIVDVEPRYDIYMVPPRRWCRRAGDR